MNTGNLRIEISTIHCMADHFVMYFNFNINLIKFTSHHHCEPDLQELLSNKITYEKSCPCTHAQMVTTLIVLVGECVCGNL